MGAVRQGQTAPIPPVIMRRGRLPLPEPPRRARRRLSPGEKGAVCAYGNVRVARFRFWAQPAESFHHAR